MATPMTDAEKFELMARRFKLKADELALLIREKKAEEAVWREAATLAYDEADRAKAQADETQVFKRPTKDQVARPAGSGDSA